MTSNTPFKICIAISACVHFTLFYNWPFPGSPSKPETRFKKTELTYFHDRPVRKTVIKDIMPINPLRRESGKRGIDPDKGKELKPKKIKMQDAPVPLVAETFQDAKTGLERGLGSEKNNAEKEAQSELLREEYYLRVRERIKSALEKNCKGRIREGEVYLQFTIDKNGVLKNLSLYKDSGRGLRVLDEIAIESIKAASPFPPFDKKMGEEELLFRQPIRITNHP